MSERIAALASTQINGNIKIPGTPNPVAIPTARKHLVELFHYSTTAPADYSSDWFASGATTDTQGNYRIDIVDPGFSDGNYKIVVDGIWVSDANIPVIAGVTNNGRDVVLVSPANMAFPPSAPTTGHTHILGWAPGFAGKTMGLKAAGATDPATPYLYAGNINAITVYRLLNVASSAAGTDYRPVRFLAFGNPNPLTVKDEFDVERHSPLT